MKGGVKPIILALWVDIIHASGVKDLVTLAFQEYLTQALQSGARSRNWPSITRIRIPSKMDENPLLQFHVRIHSFLYRP